MDYKTIALTKDEAEVLRDADNDHTVNHPLIPPMYKMTIRRVIKGVPDGAEFKGTFLNYDGPHAKFFDGAIFHKVKLPIQVQKGDKVVLCEDWLRSISHGILYHIDGDISRTMDNIPEDWDKWNWQPASSMDPAYARWEAVVKDVWVKRYGEPVWWQKKTRADEYYEVVELEVTRRE